MMDSLVNVRKYVFLYILKLELFDRMIVPIMLYGCEVWGSENDTETKKLHLKVMGSKMKFNNKLLEVEMLVQSSPV